MIRHLSIARVLVAAGIVMLVAPALVPVQPMLFHDTRPGSTAQAEDFDRFGVEVIAYENLSDRGKELYRETLRRNGEYAVPVGEGAPEFEYSSDDADADTGQGRFAGSIVIKRPPDADLPPADEPVGAANRASEQEQTREKATPSNETTGNESQTNETTLSEAERRQQLEERREQIARYDVMTVRKGAPPLTTGSNLVRLVSVVVGVVAIGVGGYRTSRP